MRHAALMLSVLLLSTSVLMIKGGVVHPFVLAAWRMWMAVVLVLPFFLRARRRHPSFSLRALGRRAFLPGLVLGLHFLSWNVGTRLTSPAHSGLTLHILPLATPLLMHAFAHDRVTRAEWIGTAFALAGMAVMVGDSYRFNLDYMKGDLVCIGSISLCGLYLALGRRNRDLPDLWLYLLPLYAITAATCLAFAVFQPDFWRVHPPWEYGMAAGLAVVCTLFGHTLMNYSLREFRGQTVSLVAQAQSLFTAFWGWLVLGFLPRPAFYLTALLMVVGVCIAILPGLLRGGARGRARDQAGPDAPAISSR